MARGTKKGNKGAKTKRRHTSIKKNVRKTINKKGGNKKRTRAKRKPINKMKGGAAAANANANQLVVKQKIEELETASINTMSFVPNAEEIDYLISSSIDALKDIESREKTPKLSKAIKNIPDSLNPNDTILAKLGRGDLGPGGEIGDKEVLTIIKDLPAPLLEKSNGPNGVLTDCQIKYGKNRINLFHEDEEQTKQLLEDYLNFRNENIKQIFDLYVNRIKYSVENLETDGEMEKLGISPQEKEHYKNVGEIMKQINELSIKGRKLSDLGIGVVSYCQSWLRRGCERNGNAHFSIMSPHFQTRFYIQSEEVLRTALSADNDEYIDSLIHSYRFIIERFTNIMRGEYSQAFIQLDGLLQQMNDNPTAAAAVDHVNIQANV